MIDAGSILDELLEDQGQDAVDATVTRAKRVDSAFRKRAKGEQKRFENATDSEFWVAICFQTREQKEEWLRKSCLADLGDKYLDGHDVAAVMGIDLTEPDPAWPTLRGPSKRLRDLT